jgi:acyl-CoA thioesterase-1
MRLVALTIAAAALLAGCGEDPAQPPPGSSADTTAGAAAADPLPVMGPERRILAFGDSLFAGYGLEEGESYPARLEAALRARGVNARITNAGVSGDTTAAGRQRLSFVLDGLAEPPDLVIVELGGNDLLRAIPPAETRANLEAILRELQRREIPVLLMGMRAPPNLGAAFVQEFDGLYPALAERYDASLVPFFLEAVYARPDLNQADRVHPTAEGIEALVAATLDEVTAALPPAES